MSDRDRKDRKRERVKREEREAKEYARKFEGGVQYAELLTKLKLRLAGYVDDEIRRLSRQESDPELHHELDQDLSSIDAPFGSRHLSDAKSENRNYDWFREQLQVLHGFLLTGVGEEASVPKIRWKEGAPQLVAALELLHDAEYIQFKDEAGHYRWKEIIVPHFWSKQGKAFKNTTLNTLKGSSNYIPENHKPEVLKKLQDHCKEYKQD